MLVIHDFSKADVTDVAVAAFLLVISVPDMACVSGLIGANNVLVIALVAVVGFIVLLRDCVVRRLMSWPSTLLSRLLLLVLRQSLLQRLLLEDPVIHEVEVELLSNEGLSKHRYDLLVVGSLFKLKLSGVIQEVTKLFWEATRQVFNARAGLLNFDLLVLLFLCLGWQALPR